MHWRMALMAAAIATWSGAACAAEITVLSGGAVEAGLKPAIAAFEKETGHRVAVTFNTAPQIKSRLEGGETVDLVIAPAALITELTGAGRVESTSLLVGRVGMGVAVRSGAPVPAIATADDIKAAVLQADAVIFNRASTGIYFEEWLKKAGVWPQIEPKTVRFATGAEVMQRALAGSGREIAFGPMTEILMEKAHGLVLVGPLPAEMQRPVAYVAAPMTASRQRDAASALAVFLAGPAGKAILAAAGID